MAGAAASTLIGAEVAGTVIAGLAGAAGTSIFTDGDGVVEASDLTGTLGVTGEGMAVAGTATGAEVAALGAMVIGVDVAAFGPTLMAGALAVAGD